MSKYQHHPDTLIALNDIRNRLQQLMEANELYREVEPDLVKHQNQGHQNAITLIDQVIKTGHTFRGSWAVPDGLMSYDLKTKSPEVTLNPSKEALG